MLAAMYRRTFENTTFTTWKPEVDKIRDVAPAGEGVRSSNQEFARRTLRKRDSYKELWIKVQFRGGPEASWIVSARGVTYRYPGHMCLHDVLAEVAF